MTHTVVINIDLRICGFMIWCKNPRTLKRLIIWLLWINILNCFSRCFLTTVQRDVWNRVECIWLSATAGWCRSIIKTTQQVCFVLKYIESFMSLVLFKGVRSQKLIFFKHFHFCILFLDYFLTRIYIYLLICYLIVHTVLSVLVEENTPKLSGA